MLGIATIDQQVNAKKDEMRSNPQAQGTVGKDLIGVMALQKLQAEKRAAENELMLAQQNNPSTIKDRLENELIGMTQNEMTNQAQGIMQQRAMAQPQQRKPQGVQQLAQRPMGGGMAPRPPMGGGIPKAMGGAQRPPMMAASGGIVGYNKGGVVSDEKLKELGMSRAQYDALPEATKKMLTPKQAPKLGKTREERTAQRLQGQKDIKANQQAFNQRLADNKRQQALDLAKAAGLDVVDPKAGIMSAQENADINAQIASGDAKQIPATPTVDDAKKFVADQYNKDAAQSDVSADPAQAASTQAGDVTPPMPPRKDAFVETKERLDKIPSTIDPSKANATEDAISSKLGSDFMDAAKQGAAVNLSDKALTESATKDSRYGVGTAAQGLASLQEEAQKEAERQVSPDFLRKKRVRDQMASRSGLARARRDSIDAGNEAKLEAKNKAVTDYTNKRNMQLEALKQSDAAIAASMQNHIDIQNNFMNTLVNVTTADREAMNAEIDQYLEVNKAFIDQALKREGILVEAELKQQLANMEDRQFIQSQLDKITAVRAEAYQKELDMVAPQIMALQQKANGGDETALGKLNEIKETAKRNSNAIALKESSMYMARLAELVGMNPKDFMPDYEGDTGGDSSQDPAGTSQYFKP